MENPKQNVLSEKLTEHTLKYNIYDVYVYSGN